MDDYRIVVVGADLFAGQELMRILEERNFPFSEIFAIKSYDHSMHFSFEKKSNEEKMQIKELEEVDFSDVDFCFLMSDSDIVHLDSKIVIDCSRKFSLDGNVQLLIPEVNMDDFSSGNGIIANPKSITIMIATIMHELQKISKVKRMVFASYQAVVEEGDVGMHELFEQTKSIFVNNKKGAEVFDKQISFNCIPKVGALHSNGSTSDEVQVARELQKIFKNPDLQITGTMVHVPVFRGNAVVLNIEFENDFDLEDVMDLFEDHESVLILDRHFEDDTIQENFATNLDAEKEDCIYISRIRRDNSTSYGLNLWLATDAVRKGLSLNAVQIAEKILKNKVNI